MHSPRAENRILRAPRSAEAKRRGRRPQARADLQGKHHDVAERARRQAAAGSGERPPPGLAGPRFAAESGDASQQHRALPWIVADMQAFDESSRAGRAARRILIRVRLGWLCGCTPFGTRTTRGDRRGHSASRRGAHNKIFRAALIPFKSCFPSARSTIDPPRDPGSTPRKASRSWQVTSDRPAGSRVARCA